MGGTRTAHGPYTVTIASPRPGAFLVPFPLLQPQVFESLPDARYGPGRCFICLIDAQVPLLRHGRCDRDKSASFFRAAAEQTLQPSSLFFFFFFFFVIVLARATPAASVPGLI